MPGWLYPPDPPFVGWRLRNPTDGRTAAVGMECFSAAHGSAWDRHKLQGQVRIPDLQGSYEIVASQRFRFYCEICDEHFDMLGPDSGPHAIVRSFHRLTGGDEGGTLHRWRYAITKHGVTAWMDIDGQGYVSDSAGIGFGPNWLSEPQPAGEMRQFPAGRLGAR